MVKKKTTKMLRITAILTPILAVAIGIFLITPLFAETVAQLGKATGFVNDYADVISTAEEAQLTSICEALKNDSSAEMAIVTINSLGGRDIESFAQELFTSWGIGQAGSDNGVLILMAINDREWRVQTGYGIEGVLTDSLARRIMENEAVSEFRQYNYGRGLVRAAQQMSDVIGGEEYSSGGMGVRGFFGFLIGVILMPFAILAIVIALIWAAVRIKCPRCGSKVTRTDNIEVLSADYSHSGIRKMDYECTVCHHVFSRMTIIPMLVQSSGSGSSSSSSSSWWSSGSSSGGSGGSSFGGFSGGSSGGGGASGGW